MKESRRVDSDFRSPLARPEGGPLQWGPKHRLHLLVVHPLDDVPTCNRVREVRAQFPVGQQIGVAPGSGSARHWHGDARGGN